MTFASEIAEVSVSFHERVLQKILSVFARTRHPEDEGVQRCRVGLVQRVKGAQVPLTRLFDEFEFVFKYPHPLPFGTSSSTAPDLLKTVIRCAFDSNGIHL